MYKNKDKQREANKLQMQRARAKGNTKQDISKGNTGYPRVTDQDFTKLMATAGPGHVRVSKPGDTDYEPQCETTKAFVESVTITKAESHVDASDISAVKALHRVISNPKQGKDIKVFEDLPPDVQQTITMMSRRDGKIEKANRTAIAINYQHVVPGRFEPKHNQGYNTVFDR